MLHVRTPVLDDWNPRLPRRSASGDKSEGVDAPSLSYFREAVSTGLVANIRSATKSWG